MAARHSDNSQRGWDFAIGPRTPVHRRARNAMRRCGDYVGSGVGIFVLISRRAGAGQPARGVGRGAGGASDAGVGFAGFAVPVLIGIVGVGSGHLYFLLRTAGPVSVQRSRTRQVARRAGRIPLRSYPLARRSTAGEPPTGASAACRRLSSRDIATGSGASNRPRSTGAPRPVDYFSVTIRRGNQPPVIWS